MPLTAFHEGTSRIQLETGQSNPLGHRHFHRDSKPHRTLPGQGSSSGGHSADTILATFSQAEQSRDVLESFLQHSRDTPEPHTRLKTAFS